MKLLIVYHVYKNYEWLEESLKSVFNQSDKNFSLVLINDDASKKVDEILNKFDFDKLNSFQYFAFNQNVGHSLSFNECINSATDDFMYYGGSNVIFDKDFVKVINETITKNKKIDVISLTKINDHGAIMAFDSLPVKLQLMLKQTMHDKIYLVRMLKERNIRLIEEQYSPFVFNYQIMRDSQKWLVLDRDLIEVKPNKTFSYNIYDALNQNDLILDEHKNTKFYKQHAQFFEFLMILNTLHVFLKRMILSYSNKKNRISSINDAKNWLTKNISNWKNNKLLNNKALNLPHKQVECYKRFKFKYSYVMKAMKNDAI